MRCLTISLIFLFALGLAGCYESVDVTVTDPGNYKGQTDPLLAKLRDGELQNNLEARFDSQTDR